MLLINSVAPRSEKIQSRPQHRFHDTARQSAESEKSSKIEDTVEKEVPGMCERFTG